MELKKLIEEKSDKQVFFVYGGVEAEEIRDLLALLKYQIIYQ